MYAGAVQLSRRSESERSRLGVSEDQLQLGSWLEVTADPESVSSSLELSKTVDLATDHVGM